MNLNKLNKILFGTLSILTIFLFSAVVVQAEQSVPNSFKKYGLSFPIKQLGNCNSAQECKNFCEDPINHQACIDFAKHKGFYKGNINQQKRAMALSSAKQNLGCDSYESCSNFCSKEENQQKCAQFAQKFSLKKTQALESRKQAILLEAKQVLGCDSYESCKNFCSNEANKQKCNDFSKSIGIKGGEVHQGPGGCQSQETCQTYCSDPKNFKECSKFHSQNSQGSFQGPGGCNSEDSCKKYCQQNPKDCGPQPSGNLGGFDPATYCKNTSGCSWTNNSCQCSDTSPKPTSSSSPSSPAPTSSTTRSAEDMCKSTSGCTWTGTTCQCTSTSTPAPSSGTSQPSTSTSTAPPPPPPPSSGCSSTDYACMCSQHGGSWTNGTCVGAQH